MGAHQHGWPEGRRSVTSSSDKGGTRQYQVKASLLEKGGKIARSLLHAGPIGYSRAAWFPIAAKG